MMKRATSALLGFAMLHEQALVPVSAWLLPPKTCGQHAGRQLNTNRYHVSAARAEMPLQGAKQEGRMFWLRTKLSAEVADRGVDSKRRKSLEAEFARLSGSGAKVGVEEVVKAAEISELLADGLLARSEVEGFVRQVGGKEGTVDVQGFIQVHVLIDTLFEEEEDKAAGGSTPTVPAVESALPIAMEVVDREWARCSKDGVMTLQAFLGCEDVKEYMDEGLLTQAEATELWKEVAGEALGPLKKEGLLSVWVRLEGLFEDMEEEEEEEEDDIEEVEGGAEDGELFAEFSRCAVGGRLSFQGLMKTKEVAELIIEGLLSVEEMEEVWDMKVKAGEADFRGFKAVMRELDAMFEEDDEEEEEEEEEEPEEEQKKQVPPGMVQSGMTSMPVLFPSSSSPASGAATQEQAKVAEKAKVVMASGAAKSELLALLKDVEGVGLEEEADAELDKKVIELCTAMASDDANLARDQDTELDELEDAVIGDWDLVYTTSRTMRFNRGLCGLGRSLPQAEFVSLSHSLTLNGYAYDMKYVEKLRSLGQNVDVIVDAAWELKDLTSVMDGSSALTLDITLQQIKYGFITEKLETGWKGVRVLNRVQVLYLDQELRVMKGQSADSFFVFRRTGDGSGATLVARPPSN